MQQTLNHIDQAISHYAPLLGRILIAAIFIQAGWDKIGGYEGTAGYMEAMGVPGKLLPLVILTELGGGLAILFGFQTRLVALALAGFSILSGLIFHFQPEDQMQMINLMKNISIAGGFLFLAGFGPGAYALDNRRQAPKVVPV